MPSIEPTTQPLNIAVVTETYPPEVNGVANTLSRFVQGLVRRGHSVHLSRPRQGSKDRALYTEAIDEYLVPSTPIPMYSELRFGWPATRQLIRHWRRFKPDVIYIATEGPLGASALKAARRLQLPVLTGFHTNFHSYSQNYGLGFLEKIITAYLRRFHNRCAYTLVPTEELSQQLSNQGFINTTVVARGVDTDLFHPSRRSTQLRQDWGVQDDEIAVIYVGRMAAEKNLDVTIDAFRALQQEYPKAKLILVGDGPDAKRVQSQNPDFIFCGVKRGEDLAAHYASADIFLFASTSETYGNVTVEAMASGLAVVTYDYAAGKAQIEHGVNGVLADFDQKTAFIQQTINLIRQPERVHSLGQAARNKAETLSWGYIIQRLETLMQDAIRISQPGGSSNA